MRVFVVSVILLLFLFSQGFAAQSAEIFYGKNLLRKNPKVEIYRENDLGIPVHVEGNLAASVRQGEEIATAYSFFEANRGAYKMANPSEELKVKKVEVDKIGMRHVRFDQLYKGLRVIGGELIAHFKKSGEMRTVNGNFEVYIDLDVNPAIDNQSASEIAHSDLISFFGETNPDQPELVVFPWQGTYYLCWRLFLYSETPMGRWEYFIDASNGDIVFKANRIMDSDAIGTGTGVMGDARNHIDTDYSGGTYYMRDYTRQLYNNPHSHDGEMPPGNLIETRLAGASLPGTVATDADNVWDDPDVQSPAVDGHVYSALVYDWWLSVFDRNSYDDNGSSMYTSVNYYGEGYDNAYWNGSRIVVWAWSSGWRSLAGCPDVIAHEWGHAITEEESNLVYQLEPGALNESFSDMIGAAFEFAHDTLDSPDWLMGENGSTSGEAFRDMANPHNFNNPDYYGTSDLFWTNVIGCTPSYSNDYCGVHNNSGVGNKWFYLLSDGGVHHGVTVTGIGVENAIQIAYRANSFYWTYNTNYHQAALGTMAAADDLDPSHAWRSQVLKAWNAVGVFPATTSIDFAYPGGIPDMVTPGQTTTFEVTVSAAGGGAVVSGSGKLYYSIGGGTYYEVSMTETSSNQYEVALPQAPCGSWISFYVSADEETNGTFYDPDPSVPLKAVAATGVVTVFADDFETDKGWTVTGDAAEGLWERGVPVNMGRGDPSADFDGSGQCYLTENDPLDSNSDVDDGYTNLYSPTFDLSGGDAVIHYARWFSNDAGSSPHTDEMNIYISNNNGADWVPVETVGPYIQSSGGWYENSFMAGDFVTPTSQMKMLFNVSDDVTYGSVVEAGIDDFQVIRYECNVNPPIILTENLPDWTVNRPYSQQLLAGGGVGVLNWTDKYDDLSAYGLSVSSSGLVTGAPTTIGDISFTAHVVDETPDEHERLVGIHINQELEITTTTLPEWTAGSPYSTELQTTGGTGTKIWLDLNDDLVGTGLMLEESGILSGAATSDGVYDFIAQASDQGGDDATQPLELTINPAVAITTVDLPDGYDGLSYSVQLEAVGGTGALTWVDKNGDLDGKGLTISETGLLSGAPIGVGTIEFTAETSDMTGSSDTRLYTLTVNEPYICGDTDNDGLVNILDIVYLINYIYKNGPAPDYLQSADVNIDTQINILDIVYLINFIYKSGPDPVCQ